MRKNILESNESIKDYYNKVKEDREVLKLAYNEIGSRYTNCLKLGACCEEKEHYKNLTEQLWNTFTVYDDECRRLEEDYGLW